MDFGSCTSHPKGFCPNCALQAGPALESPSTSGGPYHQPPPYTNSRANARPQSVPDLGRKPPNDFTGVTESHATVNNASNSFHEQGFQNETGYPLLSPIKGATSAPSPFFKEPMVSPINPRTHVYRMGEYNDSAPDFAGGGTPRSQHSTAPGAHHSAKAGFDQNGGFGRGTHTNEARGLQPQAKVEANTPSSTQPPLVNSSVRDNVPDKADRITNVIAPQQQKLRRRRDQDEGAITFPSGPPAPRDPRQQIIPDIAISRPIRAPKLDINDPHTRLDTSRGSPSREVHRTEHLPDGNQVLRNEDSHGLISSQSPIIPRRFHSFDPSSPGNYDMRPTPFRLGLQQQNNPPPAISPSQPPRSSWPRAKKEENRTARSPSPPSGTSSAALQTFMAVTRPLRSAATDAKPHPVPPSQASSTSTSKPNKLQKKSQQPPVPPSSTNLPSSPFPPRPLQSPQNLAQQQQLTRQDFVQDQRLPPSPFPPRPPQSQPPGSHVQPSTQPRPQLEPLRTYIQRPQPPPPRRYSFQHPLPNQERPLIHPPSLIIRPPPHHPPPSYTTATTPMPPGSTPSTSTTSTMTSATTTTATPTPTSKKKQPKQVRFDPTPMISPTPPPVSAASSTDSPRDFPDSDPESYTLVHRQRDRDHHHDSDRRDGRSTRDMSGGAGGDREKGTTEESEKSSNKREKQQYVVRDEIRDDDVTGRRWSNWASTTSWGGKDRDRDRVRGKGRVGEGW